MRRRPPQLIELSSEDEAFLERLIGDGHTEQRVARRARILVAMSRPDAVVHQLANHYEVARNTIWHLCRRYEAVGIAAVFDAPRSGRPWTISPPATGGDRTTGLL